MGRRYCSGREAAAFRCQAVADPRKRIRDLRLYQLLESLGDLAGLEAACADVRALGLAAQVDANALEVRLEPSLRRHHRVAAAVPERGLLPADCADLRHGRGSVADCL